MLGDAVVGASSAEGWSASGGRVSNSTTRRQARLLGRDCPFSQRLTEAKETPTSSANCACVRPRSPRMLLILRG